MDQDALSTRDCAFAVTGTAAEAAQALAPASETCEFTMHSNLLVSVMRSQAGSLSKALLELVMNSCDAGASRVDVTLDGTSFVVEDNGRGFASRQEIRDWFGCFGTPHVEGDAEYGHFRMGRGQAFSFAATRWSSNQFVMEVDLESKGMTYEVMTTTDLVKGCRVAGKLYRQLGSYSLGETISELRQYAAYALKPVYLNGEMIGGPASRLKSWTHEDDDAYYRLSADKSELLVYNKGVFVRSYDAYRMGMGGVIVSKDRLAVNFARNDILTADCARWQRIRARLRGLVFTKLLSCAQLSAGERSFLARQVFGSLDNVPQELVDAKLLTTPGGRHVPLADLRAHNVLVYSPKATAAACMLHGTAGHFVITDTVIERFGAYGFEEFTRKLQCAYPPLLAEGTAFADLKDVAKPGAGVSEQLDATALSPRQQAAFQTLAALNTKLSAALVKGGQIERARQLLVCRQTKADQSFEAITDGFQTITLNIKYFKLLESGLDGAQHWIGVLIHEYCHDLDDSESHDHGEVFYRKFHDILLDTKSGYSLGQLARWTLQVYLSVLQSKGISRPRELTRQLKG